MLACFYKRRNQNSYNIHKDEDEEKGESDINPTNVAHQPDSSIKKKQDKKQMGFFKSCICRHWYWWKYAWYLLQNRPKPNEVKSGVCWM